MRVLELASHAFTPRSRRAIGGSSGIRARASRDTGELAVVVDGRWIKAKNGDNFRFAFSERCAPFCDN